MTTTVEAAAGDGGPHRSSRLPSFITDLWREPGARDALIAASLAIFAFGMDPRALAPGMPSVQSALRDRPGLETLLLLVAVLGAGVLLVGGALGDIFRTRRLMLGALAGLLLAQILTILLPDGPLWFAARFLAIVCDGIILPFAIATVALSYQGGARATALGVVYAVMGLGLATAPALLLLFGADGPRVQAYLAAAVAAGVALLVAARRMPDMPGADPAQRPFIVGTALWAFGVVALTAGIVGFGSGDDPARMATICLGVVSLAAYGMWRRRRHRMAPDVHVEMRPVTAVLMVGIVLGLGQAAPILQIPLFFQVIQGYGPLQATIAIAPFIAALLLTGPISGWLLTRVSPRTLVAGGTIALGVGDVLIAMVIERTAGYVLFVVPFVMLGAGFVLAATVRTAIIFASTPRRLPAMAAALNEASISLGSRIGLVVATVIVTRVTLDTFAGGLSGVSNAETAAALAPLQDLLTAIGTPALGQLRASVDPATSAQYADAYVAGLRASHLVIGIATIIGGMVAGVLIGRRDPLTTVWEHRDERGTTAS